MTQPLDVVGDLDPATVADVLRRRTRVRGGPDTSPPSWLAALDRGSRTGSTP